MLICHCELLLLVLECFGYTFVLCCCQSPSQRTIIGTVHDQNSQAQCSKPHQEGIQIIGTSIISMFRSQIDQQTKEKARKDQDTKVENMNQYLNARICFDSGTLSLPMIYQQEIYSFSSFPTVSVQATDKVSIQA